MPGLCRIFRFCRTTLSGVSVSIPGEDLQLKINLVGPGNVGQTLLRRIALAGEHHIQDVGGRTIAGATRAVKFVGAGAAVVDLKDMRPADLWLLTVPDAAIAEVATRLAGLPSDRPAIAVHCSGFLTAAEMGPLRDLGWSLASVHPVLTFANPAIAVRQFEGTLCGIEGDDVALPIATSLICSIGGQVFVLKPEYKELYHAAAVFANNFTVVLQAIALEAWARSGVPSDIAQRLLERLLAATVENVKTLGPATALTGPAARGELQIVKRQEASVRSWHSEAAIIYAELSALANRLKRTGRTQL